MRLGQCVLDKVKENKDQAIQKEKEATNKLRGKFLKAVKDASEMKKKMLEKNIDPKALTNKDITVCRRVYDPKHMS